MVLAFFLQTQKTWKSATCRNPYWYRDSGVIQTHPDTTGDPRPAPKRVRTPCACNPGTPSTYVFFAFGVQRVVYLQNPDFAFSVFPPTTKIIRFWKLRWFEKSVFLRKNAKSAKIASRPCCFSLLSNSVFLVFSVSRGKCELLSWTQKLRVGCAVFACSQMWISSIF